MLKAPGLGQRPKAVMAALFDFEVAGGEPRCAWWAVEAEVGGFNRLCDLEASCELEDCGPALPELARGLLLLLVFAFILQLLLNNKFSIEII